MARGGTASPKQTPTDWVTRAADDAIRHAAAGTDRLITCASGASPSGPVHLGNLREFLTVHFVAEEIRRRGVPVRHLHSWDDYDRFRKVPGRRRPVLGRAHRPPAVGRPGPVGLPRLLGRALQGAAAGGARRDGRRDGGGLADRALPRRRLPRRRSSPRCAHRDRDRGACWPATAPRRPPRPPESEQEAAALEDSVADDGRRLAADAGSDRGWPGSPTSPTAASAAATPPRSRRTTTRPPTCLHLLRVRVRAASPTWPRRTRASWCGRSTGRCAGRSRASTSSPAASTTPPPARRTPSARSW